MTSAITSDRNNIDDRGDELHRALGRLAMLIMMASTLALAGLAGWIVLCDFPSIKGVESNVIFSIQQVLMGKPLYGNPSDFPFHIAQYSPLYYYLCAGVAKVFHLGAGDVYWLYVVGRGLSSLLEICRLGLLYGLLRREFGVGRRWSLVALGFVGISSAPWNFLARPDSLEALCMLAGIWFALKSFLEFFSSRSQFAAQHIGIALVIKNLRGFTR